MSKQKTIQQSFSFEGKGLHTGLDIVLTFVPAPENHGVKINPQSAQYEQFFKLHITSMTGIMLKVDLIL